MEALTHFKKLRNMNYIGSYELMTGETPVELVVTIEKAVKDMIQDGDGKKEAMILHLKGQKPMIVNSTNAKCISKALGTPFVENWVGKSITLYVAKIRAFGEMQDALRVRDTAPAIAAKVLPELTPAHEKWDGALTALKAKNTTIEAIQKKYTLSVENLKTLTDAIAEITTA